MSQSFSNRLQPDRIPTLGPCEVCHGQRYVPTPDHKMKPCVCLTRHRIRTYLTPTFADALLVKAPYTTGHLDGRNVFIQNNRKLPDLSFNRIFTSAVKTFLLNRRMKLSFKSVGGAKEVVDAAFGSDEGAGAAYEAMERVDLLVLYLAGDPPNKAYSSILTPLVKQRIFHGRPTWVATSYSLMPDDGQLDACYQRLFIDFIKPRAPGDPEGMGGGNFLLLDQQPIIQAFSQTRDAA